MIRSLKILFLGFALGPFALAQTDHKITTTSIPGINEFVFVQVEPTPTNLNRVTREIGYPIMALKAGIQGKIHSRILVGPDGTYKEHKITRSSHPVLAKAVEDHLFKLKFRPAIKEGKKVNYWVNVPFKFEAPSGNSFSNKNSFTYSLQLPKIYNLKKAEKELFNGLAALDTGNFKHALYHLSRSIKANSQKVKDDSRSLLWAILAHEKRGEIYATFQEWEAANLDFTQAIGIARRLSVPSLKEVMPRLYFRRALSYEHLKMDTRAFTDFQFILRHYPEFVEIEQVKFSASQIQLRSGQTSEALQVLRTYDSSSPYFMQSLLLRGELALGEGKIELAIPLFEKILAVSITPEFQLRAWNALGVCQASLGNFQKAFTLIQQAIDLDPSYPDSYYNKAKILIHLEGKESVCENLQFALINGLAGKAKHRAEILFRKHCTTSLHDSSE